MRGKASEPTPSSNQTASAHTSGIQKATRRPPKQKSCQEQSLECLKVMKTAMESCENILESVSKVVVETVVPCMLSMQQEITEVKAENSMRWESNVEKMQERELKRDERHHEVAQKFDSCAALLRQGCTQSGNANTTEETVEKDKLTLLLAPKEWLKYQILLEFVDPGRGSRLYESLSGTTLRPSKMIFDAAKWVLGEGATDVNVLTFLRQRMPEDNSSNSPPKVYSVLVTAHNRVLEPIRDAFVKSYLTGLEESNPLHPKNELGRPRRKRRLTVNSGSDNSGMDNAQKEAINLYQSGDFKIKEEYDSCWTKAWFTATIEAIDTAHILG